MEVRRPSLLVIIVIFLVVLVLAGGIGYTVGSSTAATGDHSVADRSTTAGPGGNTTATTTKSQTPAQVKVSDACDSLSNAEVEQATGGKVRASGVDQDPGNPRVTNKCGYTLECPSGPAAFFIEVEGTLQSPDAAKQIVEQDISAGGGSGSVNGIGSAAFLDNGALTFSADVNVVTIYTQGTCANDDALKQIGKASADRFAN